MRIVGPLIVSAFCATSAGATDNCAADAMIVFDGSGSMAEMGFNDINEPRIFEARRAVSETIPEIAANRRLGLVVYGPEGVDECSGLDVRFPPMANAAKPVIDAVNALETTTIMSRKAWRAVWQTGPVAPTRARKLWIN